MICGHPQGDARRFECFKVTARWNVGCSPAGNMFGRLKMKKPAMMVTKIVRGSQSFADSRLGLSPADTIKSFAMLTSLILVFVIGVIGTPALAQGQAAIQDETRGM